MRDAVSVLPIASARGETLSEAVFLVRTIGWQIILAPEGWFSHLLQDVGFINGPLDVLYTRPAVLLGVVYNYLPLMILPLFVAFDRVGPALREACKDLGAGKVHDVLPGHAAARAARHHRGRAAGLHPPDGRLHHGDRARRRQGNMVGQLVASQFQTAQNWALGSAMAVMLMVVIMPTVAAWRPVCG